MKSIYFYSDYRLYMTEYFEEQKAVRYGFSYQFFANRADIKARDFIYRVMKGEKNLSSTSSLKIAKAMDLVKKEADFFQALVEFNQASTSIEKMHFYQRMTEIKHQSRRAPSMARLADDQIEFAATWYHAVVRSLIGIIEFFGDFGALAALVVPAITMTQAKKSVELLLRLGLIVCNESGQYELCNATITTGDDFRALALHAYYRECFALAERSMDETPRELRNISGLTLGLSAKSYPIMVDRLEDLRKEFLLLAEDDTDADRVYNLTMALYPVGKTPGLEEIP